MRRREDEALRTSESMGRSPRGRRHRRRGGDGSRSPIPSWREGSTTSTMGRRPKSPTKSTGTQSSATTRQTQPASQQQHNTRALASATATKRAGRRATTAGGRVLQALVQEEHEHPRSPWCPQCCSGLQPSSATILYAEGPGGMVHSRQGMRAYPMCQRCDEYEQH